MKFSYRRLIAMLLAVIMMVSLLAACGDNSTDVSLDEIYSLNVTTKEISVGVTDSLMVLDSSDGERTYTTTWTSSDPTVVHVDSLGILTGLSAGAATVTATVAFDGLDETLTLTCAVTVKDTNVALKGISFLTESSTYTAANQIVDLSIVFDPINATNKNYTVVSSNPAVVSVQGSIAMTVGEGSAVLTATAEDGGFTAIHTVNVVFPKNDYESIKLNSSSKTITVGNTTTLKVTVSPDLDDVDPVITWSTSDASVATVDSNGKVKGIAAGTATITVTVNDKVSPHTATCKVTVKKASTEPTTVKATGVKLDTERISVNKSTTDTLKFVATVTPSNTTQTGTWKSSDTSIATVDSKTGVITINKSIDPSTAAGGMLAVKITYTIGSVSASGTLIIYPDGIDVSGGGSSSGDNVLPTGLTLSSVSANVAVGGSTALIATFAPASTTNKSVTWASSDPTVATVINGVVTGVKVGTAIITATSNADSKIKATCAVTVGTGGTTTSSISLSQTTLSLTAGDAAYTLKATLATGTVGTLAWMSSNPAVATVDTTGKVTPISAGTAIITAVCGTATATCTVNVAARVIDTDIKATLTLTLGGAPFKANSELPKGSVLFATITFDSEIPAADLAYFTYSLSSPDNSIVSVEKTATPNSFMISGLADGVARIIFSVGDRTGKYKIDDETVTYIIVNDSSYSSTITSKAANLTINMNSMSLYKDGTQSIVATLIPTSSAQVSTDDDVIWTSSDTSVAIIPRQGQDSNNGFTITNTVTAVGEGTCYITATLRSDSTKSVTFRVKVESSYTVEDGRIYLSPGSNYTIYPSNTNAYSADFVLFPATSPLTLVKNIDASGFVKSATIYVPATTTTCYAVVQITAYSSTGVSNESVNIIVEEAEEIEVTVKSTTKVSAFVGEKKSLTVGNDYFSYVGETPIWYIDSTLSDEGVVSISAQMGTSVTATALGVGTAYVYCEYGDNRDVYVITVQSPTSSAANFTLTSNTGTTVQGSGQFIFTFASKVTTSGTVTWRVNSSEFTFAQASSTITNGMYATNTVSFAPIGGRVVTSTETYTITATFIPQDGGVAIEKTITVYITPVPTTGS